MVVSEDQFERVRRLASFLAGIALVDRHRELIGRRASRLGIRDMESFVRSAEADEPEAVQQVISIVTTRFTRFFRHPHHFEIAVDQVDAALRQRGFASIWCAGAATGEEPYSMAMAIALSGQMPCATTRIQILATDIHRQHLGFAKKGEYPEAALKELAPIYRDRFFAAAGDGSFGVSAALRQMVEFQELNLARAPFGIRGPFDVVFCRNVLMYLEGQRRYGVLSEIARLLRPNGLLLLDPSEHPGDASHLFTPGQDGAYYRERDKVSQVLN